MKTPIIDLKRTLELLAIISPENSTRNEEFKNNALKEDCNHMINLKHGIKDEPHDRYSNQIIIEQL